MHSSHAGVLDPQLVDGSGAAAAPESTPARMRTEFGCELPRGYVNADAVLHPHGTMRLSTARNELLPLYDERVQ